MKKYGPWWLLVFIPGVWMAACGGEQIAEEEYFGKFDLVNDFDKADGMGQAAVPASADDSDTAVWEVWNDWADTDTSDARRAGLAWEADSGLDWNQKFALWIDSLSKTDAYSASYKTFTITNPQGKTIQAPVLECAETAYYQSSGNGRKTLAFRRSL